MPTTHPIPCLPTRSSAQRGRGGVAGFATALLVACLAAGAPGLAAQETYSLTGSRVAVYNLAGQVEVVPGNVSDVMVEVTRSGSDGAGIEVGVRTVDGRQALVLRYPDDEVVYGARGGRFNTTVMVRGDGTFYGGRRGGDRVRVRGSGSGMEAWADLRITVPAGRDLAVYLAVGAADVEGMEGDLLLDMGSGSAEVRSVRGMVEVDTGSGDVTVADIEGELVVDTGSGFVRLDGVQGPAVTVDTGSGDVRGQRISTTTAEFDTGSGDVAVEGLDARDVLVDTGSGDIGLTLTGSPERVAVDTGSGAVRLSLPAGIDAMLEVDTGSGGIDADLAMDVIERERRELRARLGNGRGRITVDTGSGNVVIRGG